MKEPLTNMNATMKETLAPANDSNYIDSKAKRNYENDVVATIATVLESIVNTTTNNNITETTEAWETTAEMTTELVVTTMPPPPAEPPCQQYWYDLNTTTVYHVSQGKEFRRHRGVRNTIDF